MTRAPRPRARACGWPLAKAQVVKVSDEELRFLTGSDDPSAARRKLWHDQLELMVVTLGAAGCVYFTPDHEGVVVGLSVQAVEPRGPATASSRVCCRPGRRPRGGARSATPARICRLACAVGALTTTERGAIPALPTLERVRHFLDERPGASPPPPPEPRG